MKLLIPTKKSSVTVRSVRWSVGRRRDPRSLCHHLFCPSEQEFDSRLSPPSYISSLVVVLCTFVISSHHLSLTRCGIPCTPLYSVGTILDFQNPTFPVVHRSRPLLRDSILTKPPKFPVLFMSPTSLYFFLLTSVYSRVFRNSPGCRFGRSTRLKSRIQS